jgi:hypothetical protein
VTDPAWEACLDAFAARLDEQCRSLAAGLPEQIEAFAPHLGLGPLPPHLGVRARELAERAARLEHDLAAARARTAAELRLLTVVTASSERSATLIDSRG